MQNYLFYFVIQGNLCMICTFLFWQKKTPFYDKIVDGFRRRLIFHKFCHGLFKIIAERIHIFQVAQGTGFDIHIRNYLNTLLSTNFFSFLRETLLRWQLNLFQFSFVNESMFNLFASIKPKIQKFTLLIEKVSKKNSIKYEFFSTKFGSLLKVKQYA